MVRKSLSKAGPEAAIILAISPLLIMPGMAWCIPGMPLIMPGLGEQLGWCVPGMPLIMPGPGEQLGWCVPGMPLIMPGPGEQLGWCVPGMPLAVGAGTGCPNALSQALMRLISGPWSALIFTARPLTFWECAREAASPAIATAWRWWTIICWANVTSAALCAPGTTETEADRDPDTGAATDAVAELTPPAARTTTATARPADQVSAVFRAVQRMEGHISTSRSECSNTEY